jgi:uncharacterized protein (TIGR02246 family)
MDAADEIRKVGDRMNAFVAVGDIKSILTLMTEDVVFLPPNDTPKVGKDEYHKWVAQFQDRFAVKSTTQSREIRVAGDQAYEWGLLQETFTPRQAGAQPMNFDGKFLRIFLRQPDGAWKIARATWSSNHPAAG